MIRDRAFNRGLARAAAALDGDTAATRCTPIRLTEPRLWLHVRSFFVFHVLRTSRRGPAGCRHTCRGSRQHARSCPTAWKSLSRAPAIDRRSAAPNRSPHDTTAPALLKAEGGTAQPGARRRSCARAAGGRGSSACYLAFFFADRGPAGSRSARGRLVARLSHRCAAHRFRTLLGCGGARARPAMRCSVASTCSGGITPDTGCARAP